MDDKTRRKICQLIAGLVVSDDDLDPTEDAFIDRLFAKFGFEAEARSTMFPIVDREEAAAAMKALPEQMQGYVLDMLIEAAAADGKVVSSEQRFLESVGKALGLDLDDLRQRINERLTAL